MWNANATKFFSLSICALCVCVCASKCVYLVHRFGSTLSKSKYFECIFAYAMHIWNMIISNRHSNTHTHSERQRPNRIMFEMCMCLSKRPQWFVQTFQALIRMLSLLSFHFDWWMGDVRCAAFRSPIGYIVDTRCIVSVRQTCHKTLNFKSLIKLNNKLSLSENMMLYFVVECKQTRESTIEIQLICTESGTVAYMHPSIHSFYWWFTIDDGHLSLHHTSIVPNISCVVVFFPFCWYIHFWMST